LLKRSKVERRRYYEVSRGSVIEVDTALDIAFALDFCKSEDLTTIGILINRAFSLLCGVMDE
jgi:hypothetical protein